jgi:hypothetical protein
METKREKNRAIPPNRGASFWLKIRLLDFFNDWFLKMSLVKVRVRIKETRPEIANVSIMTHGFIHFFLIQYLT